MQRSMAFKLILLVTVVAVVLPLVIGGWIYFTARGILLDHELVDLNDETQLRAYEVLTKFLNARRDIRDLAISVNLRQFLTDTEGGREEFERDVRKVLIGDEHEARKVPSGGDAESRLELSILKRNTDRHRSEWQVVFWMSRDPQGTPKSLSLADCVARPPPAYTATLAQELTRKVRGEQGQDPERYFPVCLSRVEQEQDGGPKPRLVVRAAAPVLKDGQLTGLAVLTMDFAGLCEPLTMELPRHLVFLTASYADEEEQILLHPSGDHTLRPLAEDLQLKAFLDESDHSMVQASARNFRVESGHTSKTVLREELTFWLSQMKLGPRGLGPDEATRLKNAEELNKWLKTLAREQKNLKYDRLTRSSELLRLSSMDHDTLSVVQQQVDQQLRQLGIEPRAWRAPLRCSRLRLSYALMKLEAGPPTQHRLGTVNVAVAAAEEEMYLDVTEGLGPMLWVGLGVGLFAAGVAGGGAWWITRSLHQITAATEAFARGETDLNLPVGNRDEIGTLARAFQHMATRVSENQSRLEAIVRTAAEGIFTMDDEGNLESFNPAAETIFGYGSEEVLGKSFTLLLESSSSSVPSQGLSITTDDPPAALAQHLAGAPTQEVVGRRKDGTCFSLEMSCSTEHTVGSRRLITSLVRDITERKVAEQQLTAMNRELDLRVQEQTAELRHALAELGGRATELEEANARLQVALEAADAASRAKSAFLADMNHELRTPLNAIMGPCQMVLRNLKPERWQQMLAEQDGTLASKRRQEMESDLKGILISSEHLLAVITDILDLSKIAAGKLHFHLHPFDLGKFLGNLETMARPLADKNRNRLTVQFLPENQPPGTMCSDETRLRQVLLNLLSNACKFTLGGQVDLTARRQPAEGGDWVVFVVKDTGMGMSPQKRARIFEEFEQGDRTISMKYGGTGLGLVLSRRLAELLRGQVKLTWTEEDKGSIFTVTLPATIETTEDPEVLQKRERLRRALAQSTREPRHLPPCQPNLVLAIDDDLTTLDLMRRFLEERGYQVQTASSGEEGLRVARQQRPAVITLDVQMPAPDGWDVLFLLKSDATTADIPVIIVTVVDEPARGLALGAADYLLKPIDFDRLGALLRRYSPGPTAHVLLVEPECASRTALRTFLEREGWAVAEAGDSQAAWERLAERPPNVVLLEPRLPDSNGLAFLDSLRQKPGYDDLPVVVVSATPLSPGECRRLRVRPDAVINLTDYPKPEELLAAVLRQINACLRPPAGSLEEGPHAQNPADR